MTKDEIRKLAEYTQHLWVIYQKMLYKPITDENFQEFLDECRKIWEESKKDQLVMDMATAFMNDIDRRSVEVRV